MSFSVTAECVIFSINIYFYKKKYGDLSLCYAT